MDKLFLYNRRGVFHAVIYGLLNTRNLVEPVTVERLEDMAASGYLEEHHNDFEISRNEAARIRDYFNEVRSSNGHSYVSELHREFPVLGMERDDYLARTRSSLFEADIGDEQRHEGPTLWDSQCK